MKRTTTKVLLAGIAAACLTAFTAPASAQSTLDAVKKRGKLICGVSQVSAGFAFPDSKGVMQGFDVDICRAVSAAIFGSGDKVDFLATNINTRFQVLQSGEIDILSRQTTQTFSRDNSLGLDFGPVVFYDGQGMMVPKKLNITSAKDLEGAAICVLPGTTTLQNLSDFFRTRTRSSSRWCSRTPMRTVTRSSRSLRRDEHRPFRPCVDPRRRQQSGGLRGAARDDLQGASRTGRAPGQFELARHPQLDRLHAHRRRREGHHEREYRSAAQERGSRDPAHAGRHAATSAR